MNQIKTCSHCDKNLSSALFHKDKRAKDGLCHKCKECSSKFDAKRSNKRKDSKKQYYLNNQLEFQKYGKNYAKQNRNIINIQRKNRYHSDIQYKLRDNLRSRLRKFKNRAGSAIRDLGCSVEFLKQYLEQKFIEGMSWENHGNKEGQWSIDHIIALSTVDLTNREQFLRVAHYTNLQPMWHIDNIQKGTKCA